MYKKQRENDAEKHLLPRKNVSNTGHPVDRNVRHNSGEQLHFKICKAIKYTQKIIQHKTVYVFM